MNFAGTLRGWLLLLGKYGCGKTHLAAAIANQAVSMGVSTLFLTVPDLLDWLRFSYSEGSEDSFEQRFRRNPKHSFANHGRFWHSKRHQLGARKAFSNPELSVYQSISHGDYQQYPLSSFEGCIRSRLMDLNS